MAVETYTPPVYIRRWRWLMLAAAVLLLAPLWVNRLAGDSVLYLGGLYVGSGLFRSLFLPAAPGLVCLLLAAVPVFDLPTGQFLAGRLLAVALAAGAFGAVFWLLGPAASSVERISSVKTASRAYYLDARLSSDSELYFLRECDRRGMICRTRLEHRSISDNRWGPAAALVADGETVRVELDGSILYIHTPD